MSDVRIDIFGAETRVGDVVAFKRPGKTLLIEGKVAKLTPKGISVEYDLWADHPVRTFVVERQFVRKPTR